MSTTWIISWSPLVGVGCWGLLLLAPLDGAALGIPERTLQFAMLVIVPLAWQLAAPVPPRRGPPWSIALAQPAQLAQLVAALLAALAFGWPAGPVAAVMTIPWLALTLLAAGAGLARARTHRLTRLDELAIDVSLVYLAVGGGWLTLARLGARPLDFAGAIVLLTAVHFHYAGLVAPLLTGLAGRWLLATGAAESRFFPPIASLVIAGPALVAAGITVTALGSPRALEVLASVVQAAGLIGLAAVMLVAIAPQQGPLPRGLLTLSAVSVMVAMLLAVGYAAGPLVGASGLTIPTMILTHGLLNAGGFAAAGLLGWLLVPPVGGTQRAPGKLV